MATCPNCKGHLTEGHRCPRRRLYVVAEIIASGIVGAVLSFIVLVAFDPFRQATDMESTALIAGFVVGVGLNRILRS